MRTFSETECRLIWEKSAWLSQASEQFASAEQRAEHKRLWSQSVMKAIQDGATTAGHNAQSMMDLIGAGLKNAEPTILGREKLASTLRSQLIDRLLRSALIGFGFEGKRTLHSQPVLLPKEVWSGSVQFEANSVQYQSIKLLDVRIAHPGWLPSDMEVSTPAPAQVGRPSMEQDLKKCFEELNLNGEIDFNASMSSHYPLIQAWLSNAFPEKYPLSNQLSSEGVRRYFSPYFKRLKAEGKAK